jgi:hypothetical protein
MKRAFFIGIIAYSVMIFLTNDWYNAINTTDNSAWFWIVKCLVDFCFAGFGLFKVFGKLIHFDEDEVGIHEDDITVPDTWLYGLFGLNLIANCSWHAYQFKSQSGAESAYNSVWFFVEFVGVVATFILYKHAAMVAVREQRKARAAAKFNDRGSSVA